MILPYLVRETIGYDALRLKQSLNAERLSELNLIVSKRIF